MKKIKHYLLVLIMLLLASCAKDDSVTRSTDIIIPDDPNDQNQDNTPADAYNILSLGDSYTIGQSVCQTCRFPEQLKDSLISRFPEEDSFNLKIIAQTGWTTNNLINAINNEIPASNNDLVTLLIGVNNQFRNISFLVYQKEFPELINKAIILAKNNKANVIVVSIPDYAYTPFGQNNGNPENTSIEIDQYNAFAEGYCNQQNITFVNITDITREGLDNIDLVALDGLHPSELAYTKFVERLLPIALQKIQ